MQKTVVLNVVGLTPSLAERMPRLRGWQARGATRLIRPAFPAVTCSAQSDYLTGVRPERHGIVGNGWYSREDHEVRFWKQSNALVQAPKIWEVARAEDPSFTCANLFWWFNMYSSADVSVTPRPMYPADGRKIPDVYTRPAALRETLQSELGTFPLFEFWGPRASIRASQWIARAALRVDALHAPTLTLIYLPHLDYDLQRFGVSDTRITAALDAIDVVCDELVRHYEAAGAAVVVLSEYGITDVSTPVHLNRILRTHGYIAVREERGLDVLDPGASAAFAVADHQIAHVYVNEKTKVDDVRAILQNTPGVAEVLDEAGKRARGIAHERAGDLVAIADRDAWFTYYYWIDETRAPDYARTVDIHRKPGYDPVELFLDPAMRVPALSVGWKLAKRKAGFRTLLDVIPLDASLVRGSHGRADDAGNDGPVLISNRPALAGDGTLQSTDVFGVLLQHLRGA